MSLYTTFVHLPATDPRSCSQEMKRILLDIKDISIAQPLTQDAEPFLGSSDIPSIETKLSQAICYAQDPSLEPTAPNEASHSIETAADSASSASESNQFGTSAVATNVFPSAPPILSIVMSIAQNKCESFCKCQCHTRTTYSTPRWMKALIGSLYFGYTGTPLLSRRPCDYPLCCKSGAPSSEFTYQFPLWTVARVFRVSGRSNDLTGVGASWTIKIPRVIPSSSLVFRQIMHGSVEDLQTTFQNHLASPYDVDEDGRSLLRVCSRLAPTPQSGRY